MIDDLHKLETTAREEAREGNGQPEHSRKVKLRKFPFPYKAAMTICSDIDETRTTDEFLQIQRFLNTREPTGLGQGLGLEIGNSFYFYNNAKEFSYFDQDERARRVIEAMIRSGYIDCLHSFGDTDSRDDIVRALNSLHESDCRLEVWVNHFGASSDICKKFEYMFKRCEGDDPAANVYHTDLTLDYGIRFAWVGATTRIVGQSPIKTSGSLSTVFNPRHPWVSAADTLKELRKQNLGRRNDERFVLHRQNELTRPLELGDGRRVYEFMRFCNHPEGIPVGATSRGLAQVISARNLQCLITRQGYMIVYAHLGKNSDCSQAIAAETQQALRHLADLYHDGQIYVSTTAKLLKYHFAHHALRWTQRQVEGRTRILIDGFDDPVEGNRMPSPSELQGITFYATDSNLTDVFLGPQQLERLQRNPADENGVESVTIPLTTLSFPNV